MTMIKISRISGIIASIIALVICIVFGSLHFAEGFLTVILYAGIAGAVVLLIASLASTELNKLVFFMSVVGTSLILIAYLSLLIALTDVSKFVTLPFVIISGSLSIISTLLEGMAIFVYYRQR